MEKSQNAQGADPWAFLFARDVMKVTPTGLELLSDSPGYMETSPASGAILSRDELLALSDEQLLELNAAIAHELMTRQTSRVAY